MSICNLDISRNSTHENLKNILMNSLERTNDRKVYHEYTSIYMTSTWYFHIQIKSSKIRSFGSRVTALSHLTIIWNSRIKTLIYIPHLLIDAVHDSSLSFISQILWLVATVPNIVPGNPWYYGTLKDNKKIKWTVSIKWTQILIVLSSENVKSYILEKNRSTNITFISETRLRTRTDTHCLHHIQLRSRSLLLGLDVSFITVIYKFSSSLESDNWAIVDIS